LTPMKARMSPRNEWVSAPVCGHFEHGKRWQLRQDGREVGRVVQLLPGGLWEASSEGFYSPGHDTLGQAARALLGGVRS
jgi:hypothetical protein